MRRYRVLWMVVGLMGLGADGLCMDAIGVSPGSGSRVDVVEQTCPTFSWSLMEGAVGYRLEVFESLFGEAPSHEDMERRAGPVLRVEIAAPALSWTPSAEEALSAGVTYAWYVQGVDAFGQGLWSEGRIFKVGVSAAAGEMKEEVKQVVREYLVEEVMISDVAKEVRTKIKGEVGKERDRGAEGKVVRAWENPYNTFLGLGAGESNTTGISNTFLGSDAGHSNTFGAYNTFVGTNAGYFNTTGDYNTFVGLGAGYSNTGALNNTFVGHSAGKSNTTGSFNTFLGKEAGNSNTTGDYNTFVGIGAGLWNITGRFNTFLGNSAGYSNTSGAYNTFLGNYAGRFNHTGAYNTFMGNVAGYSNTEGWGNTLVGIGAGYSNTTGSFNTFVGLGAGLRNTTGELNVLLGFLAGGNEKGSNKLYIHNSDSATPLVYGDFSVRTLKINGVLTSTNAAVVSDFSFKKEIQPLDAALEKVTRLRPVHYRWRTEEYSEKGFGEEMQIGLIAQEVEPILPELVHTDPDGRKSLSYDKLTAVLAGAIKEQQNEIKRQQARIEAQQLQIEELRSMIRELKRGS